APSPPAAPSAAFASAPAAATRSASLLSANVSSASIQTAAPALQSRASAERATAREAEHAAERAAGIVAALLMGDQRAIVQSDWLIFRRTGVSHLLSISGLHITLFAWLAAGLIGALWRQSARWGWAAPCLWLPAPTAALWGGVALAAAYAWFSGWGVPAQRTCLMLLCVAALRARGFTWPWWQVLAAAAAAVLLLAPWALLQPGFWLSFVAVGVLFATAAPQATARHTPQHLAQKARRALTDFLRAQGAIMLALTPLTLLLFGQVSLIGFIANAVAVPLITFVVTPLALLGTLWPPLWQGASILLQGLMALLQYLAAIPWASYQVAIAPAWAGAAGMAAGWLLMLRLPWAWRCTAALGLLPVLLWQAPRPAHGHFDLLAADVGQGSAILVRTRRHSLLFDTGPQYSARSDAGERVLVPLLDALNEHPDWLLLSHQDGDHIGGTPSLLAARPQMQVLGSISADHPLQQLRPVMPCTAGQAWQWDGVTFTVLHPSDEELARPAPSNNAMSCVLHIGNGQRSALLAGDIGTAQERAIIARQAAEPASLRADVLLVGHHGSKTSSSDAWLDAVQPHWAVIQQGYLNPYRHPHPTVMQRLQARGIATYLSESCGAAQWDSASGHLQCERARNRRYWQHPVAASDASLSEPVLDLKAKR
ncbi:MAG: DNA internalization-related competence protein ComEC/Rec2, partial [Brachymonas sp.]|nr:DNA internalization-related competence protein ComEC/Rec2 [Brachymonas sp.]